MSITFHRVLQDGPKAAAERALLEQCVTAAGQHGATVTVKEEQVLGEWRLTYAITWPGEPGGMALALAALPPSGEGSAAWRG